MATRMLHVLVVEDHESTKHVLVKMLGRSGHQVMAATDSAEAEAAGAFQQFDLLISDIGLPDLNGWELLGRLRKGQRDMRSIALTGYGYPNDMKRSQQVGFDLHLTKPAEWPAVEAAIKSLFPDLAGKNGPPGRVR